MGDHHGDKVLARVPVGSPGLSQAEYDIRAWGGALPQGVLFEQGEEAVVVVEDLGPLLLLQRVALVAGG